MSESTEITNKTLLEEIKKIGERLDKIEQKHIAHDGQFEGIRQGLVQNAAAFDRLESVVYSVRSDVSGLKADIKEFTEQVHLAIKSKETLKM